MVERDIIILYNNTCSNLAIVFFISKYDIALPGVHVHHVPKMCLFMRFVVMTMISCITLFREYRTKFDPQWEDSDTVLSYSLDISYTYDEELSTAGDPTQIKITTINVPLIVSQKLAAGSIDML